MFGYLGMTMLLASSWLTAWRFYVWAKREERRASYWEKRHKSLVTRFYDVMGVEVHGA
jgi:hypothetical protein